MILPSGPRCLSTLHERSGFLPPDGYALLSAGVLCLASCGRTVAPAPGTPTPAASGSPGVAFGRGFHLPETLGPITTIRWAHQDAVLRVEVPEEGRYRLTFLPFTAFTMKDTHIEIRVNGRPAGEISTGAFEMADARPTPVELTLRAGVNAAGPPRAADRPPARRERRASGGVRPPAAGLRATGAVNTPPPGTGPPRALRPERGTVLAACALAAVFTLWCLQWSLTHGRLSQDATYDDCAYLYDGGSRLMILYEHGGGAFLANAARYPAHAPFSTYAASAGFALFGFHDWAPYVLNGGVVAGLLVLVGHVARPLPLPGRAGLMALVLTLPIALSAVHDFRPDALCALLSVAGMYLVVEAGVYRVGTERRRALVAGGLAFGLALWAKPPVFALTLVTAALATGGAWLAGVLFEPPRDPRDAARSALRTGAAVGLPCALVAAPYYALNGGEVVRYFLYSIFDKKAAFWQVPGGWAGAVRYYLFGESGELLMGRGFYAWVVLYGLTLGWIVWRRHAREAVLQGLLLLLTLVSLGAVLYGRLQNAFFGTTWVMLLALTCVRGWAFLFSTLPPARWRGILGAALLLGLGTTDLTLLRLRKSWPHHAPAVDELVGRGHSINGRILDDISRELARRGGSPAQPPVTFLTVTGFINEATLRWLAFREGRALAFSDLQQESRVEPFRQAIENASFVVSGEDKTGGVFENLPPWKLRCELADLVAAEERAGRLRLLARYPTSAGGSYRLFVNDARLAPPAH